MPVRTIEQRLHNIGRWIPIVLAGFLMLCLAPPSPAQTTGKSTPGKAKDTSATKSASPDTMNSDEEDERDDEAADSSAAVTTPSSAENPVEQEADTSTAPPTQSKKPLKAGKRSAIYKPEEEEIETAWELDARLDYDSWRVRRGLEFSRALPCLTPSLLLTHESGLSLEVDAMSSYGKVLEFTLWYVILGYEYDFTDWATGSFQYTRYRYKDSEENAVASKFNAWTLIGNFDASFCAVDLTFDLYPGDASTLYVTLDVSRAFESGDWTFTPLIETCYLAANFQVGLPPPLPPKDVTLRGLATLSLQCEIAWQATDQLALSFNPAFTRFPIIEAASKTRGFSTTLSAVYTFEF